MSNGETNFLFLLKTGGFVSLHSTVDMYFDRFAQFLIPTYLQELSMLLPNLKLIGSAVGRMFTTDGWVIKYSEVVGLGGMKYPMLVVSASTYIV